MASKKVRPLVLDSCVWIAYLHKEDSQHEKACVLLNTSEVRVHVPEYVLVEVVQALSNKGRRQQAVNFLDRVLSDPSVFIPVADLVYDTAVRFRKDEKGKLSFVDMALLVLSERYDVITFDKHLVRALTRR